MTIKYYCIECGATYSFKNLLLKKSILVKNVFEIICPNCKKTKFEIFKV